MLSPNYYFIFCTNRDHPLLPATKQVSWPCGLEYECRLIMYKFVDSLGLTRLWNAKVVARMDFNVQIGGPLSWNVVK